MKLTKQDIDKVRNMEGFPLGSDEDIIDLSNGLNYTACPNPFIEEFINKNGKIYDEETDDYKCLPYTVDISEGKSDELYNIHTYHTKVPPKAILRYILHYTKPGEIIYDAFCGSGMTGVATALSNCNTQDIRSILDDDMIKKIGKRNCILSDISTAATFIASNYNTTTNTKICMEYANQILENIEKELGWMYKTYHSYNQDNDQLSFESKRYGTINYVVWSDILLCPNCSKEINFYNVGIDKETGLKKTSKKIVCDACRYEDNSTKFPKCKTLEYDEILGESIEVVKQEPVLINYTFNGKKYDKKPDEHDFEILKKIDEYKIDYQVPIEKLQEGHNTKQPINSHNINYLHQFYNRRSLISVAKIYEEISKVDVEYQNLLKFWIQSVSVGFTKMNRYFSSSFSQVNRYLKGTLYIAPVRSEVSPWYCLKGKVNKLGKLINNDSCVVTTQSSTMSNIPDNSIDYVFIDPPFGANIMYSELNFIWESWLKVKTNNDSEAIINNAQGKNDETYQELMSKVFEDLYRVLKPGRWMTIEFHNSKNVVWNMLQNSILNSGLIIADVRILDKKQQTMKQFSTNNSVDKDLVISAFKPRAKFEKRFLKDIGTEDTAWNFIRERLENLPIVVKNGDYIEKVREREALLLFDRMVAYHIMKGISVPIDAADFYLGLDERFIKRDDMYFLPDQVNEYDNARIYSELENIQLCMLVTDEKSAISWLYNELKTPQLYSQIQPKFVQELRTLKYEEMPELIQLLEENFINDNNGKWYIPDPTKLGDIIKLREKRLIKEFEEYLNGKGKLKSFRTEAIRAGFAKLWKDKDYENIVKVADRLPESVIQEDDKLLMYYDISLSRIE